MKKLLLVLVIVIIPVMAFADFQLGATAVYYNDASGIGSGGISGDDFVFGLDTRLKIWIFQAGASAQYMSDVSTILLPLDVGLSFNVWFMRFGAGIGPVFAYSAGGDGFNKSDLWNLKLMGDINIGSLSLGLVGYYYADSLGGLAQSFTDMPWLGVSVLFKLF